tara:strand:- start:2025 stop:2450 length:426 start_codon:yes stop_codon:yes gene_type:complete
MGKIDKNIIKEMSDLMDKNNLIKFKFSDGDLCYEIEKKNNIADPKVIKNFNEQSPKIVEEKNFIEKSLKSPLVGTVYLSPEPGSNKFINIGQSVKIGQVLLIIEAMKTMNEITADKDGIVKKIFVKNGDPVEFGEQLVLIE